MVAMMMLMISLLVKARLTVNNWPLSVNVSPTKSAPKHARSTCRVPKWVGTRSMRYVRNALMSFSSVI